MATTVKPLDGTEGYLRWKESLLLRLHSLNVAHALSEDCPAAGDQAARKWARDDAVCRGHILATLSDRIFPDYAHHATARALWQAVARTYELETRSISWRNLKDFEYDEGAPLLEQLAHLEALGVGAKYSDDLVAGLICEKLPEEVASPAVARSDNGIVSMSLLWDVARRMAAFWIDREDERRRDEEAAMAEDQAGFADVL